MATEDRKLLALKDMVLALSSAHLSLSGALVELAKHARLGEDFDTLIAHVNDSSKRFEAFFRALEEFNRL